MHPQKRIAGAERPSFRYFPFYRGLHALRRAVHFVSQRHGVHEKEWGSVRIEEGRKKLFAFEAMIIAKEHRHIYGKLIRGLRPIANLIRDDVFRLHVWVAEQDNLPGPG